jgi:leucyl-tRNA synthetase
MELINATIPHAEDPAPTPGVGWALREAFEVLARILCPFAPHFAEELHESLGGTGFVAAAGWPVADPAVLAEDVALVVVQVNGKLRARVTLPKGASEEAALDAARGDANVAVHLDGKALRRVVYVPDKLLNLVVA